MRNLRTRDPADGQRSLFGEVLDWLLAPLMFVWPISIAATHYFANQVAAYPYDQGLRENASAISRQVVWENRRPRLVLPTVARAVLHSDETDAVYFRVVSPRGKHLAGDRDLPPMPTELETRAQAGVVSYRDAELAGEPLRIAYLFVAPDSRAGPEHWVLVEVGETLGKRNELANKIIASVILPQFVMIPIAVVLVWFGLGQGLRALTRLRQRIEARREADLSPIHTQRVPEELRPLVDAFNSLLDRVRRGVEAQNRFIADAAHQMRTPLAGLKAQAQSALREKDPEQLHSSLQQIAHSVDRATRLVSQLLSLARAEGGVQAASHAPIDMGDLLRDVVADAVDRAELKQVELGLDLPDEPVPVLGDPFWLREMLVNLIDNALRYTPGGGSVSGRLRPAGGGPVTVDIVDTGVGINEKERDLVFERFYRAADSVGEGSGLGLSIVREIAEAHRARVVLLPNPAGNGTIARVMLPPYQPPPEPPALPAPDVLG